MIPIHEFQEVVWQYYRDNGRHDLPWRQSGPSGDFDPYNILVSELMLQQTQVSRVIPKFTACTAAFPSFDALAAAPLADVLKLWSGLGYNRRAKFLHQTARIVVDQHGGQLPNDQSALVALPGIGVNTAGAIRAYAFNDPVVFIETNIRTVFIHHFFADQDTVSDAMLLPIITEALPDDDVRSWYWALMDYGTFIKQTVGNISRASATYAKQSTFEGSRRQVRGQVLKALASGPLSPGELQKRIPDERLDSVLHDLSSEGFIAKDDEQYKLFA